MSPYLRIHVGCAGEPMSQPNTPMPIPPATLAPTDLSDLSDLSDLPVRVSVRDPHGLASRLAVTAAAAAAPSSDHAAGSARWYALALRARELRAPAAFDTLLAPRVLRERVEPLPYQTRVVERVLRELAPAALLADEVGLGKTIEAGLVYKELALRGIIRSALVLAPKALLAQWQAELRERFDADFVLTDEKRFRGFAHEDRVICSLPQFVRSFERVGARAWDLLVVDEAHLLANPASKRRRAVALLRARWRLLLTATPVANKLTDLYSLVDLVRPGVFGTPREFEAEYVADPGTARVVRPGRVAALREAVHDVTCRTRRAETTIAFTARHVETHTITMAPDEDAMVAEVTTYLRALYRRLPPSAARAAHAAPTAERGGQAAKANRGALIREILALQQSLSSSPRAIAWSLRRRAERHADERDALLALAERCERVESAKERLLLALLDALRGEPALIFTLRLQTAERLRAVLCGRGQAVECYVGALARAEREELVERFNGGALDALIATDAGAEGLNLQRRCRIVVNYDLHWNPMRIEQRIGRVHRLGQSRDVAVHNFALRDTVDEYVLRLLYEKINLFTMTVGALETVLAEAHDGELDVEERILEALLTSDTRERLTAEVAALGQELSDARDRQRDAESLTEGVLG